jgi:hypothetical protein
MAGRKGSRTDGKEETSGDRCGECKKMVSRNDKGIMSELCETWFHCKCQEVSDDTYEVMRKFISTVEDVTKWRGRYSVKCQNYT